MTRTAFGPSAVAGQAGPGQQVRGGALVLVGLGVLGLANYVFLTVTARAVRPAEYAALAALYLLMSILGPGVFSALEQETSRLVSTRLAHGLGVRTVVRQATLTTALLVVPLLVAMVLFAGPLTRSVLGGDRRLLAALMLSVVGFAGVYLTRGLFSGQRHFGRYAINVGAEGLVRLVFCVLLPLLAVASPAPYAFALCAAPAAAMLLTAAWFRPGTPGPAEPWAALAQATAWLLAAQLLSQAMANIGPVLVKASLADAHRAGVFAAAFVLARVPLFVFVSAQTILLPTLARASARRDIAGLRKGVRQALGVVAALGVVGVSVAAVVGDELVRLIFGPDFVVSWTIMPLLTAGTVLSMAVLVLQPGLLSVGRHHVVALAWIAGMAVFFAVFLLPADPVAEAVAAQIIGPAVTAGIMAVVLIYALRRAGSVPIRREEHM
ncbi:MAG TPA: oligosaccharide flippase family protein [Micromonosporaceae bacterium]|nr:oligosaccharide flippase family protein [Micromonosporaceae bacterium]